MEYINSVDAAKKLNITTRRIQQMCKNGEIYGAKKQGRTWMIPSNFTLFNETKKKPLPIGISDYIKASIDYYYVDKTLLIKDFIDSRPEVSLFMRPRRFGKTLNMDMLRVFFEKTNKDTSIYFKDKLIWKCGEEYRDYQGKYPVIFLTFKDIKCDNWSDTYQKICKLISFEFLRHSELENSKKLNTYEKEIYLKYVKGEMTEIDYEMSLQFLTAILTKHYEEKTIIIIDEYDTPIQQGHSSNFYLEVISFMRSFFSGGLKDNPNLAYGFLTGILRIAKESIFSGLNNIKINTILDKEYSQYFGFTIDEVKQMLEYYDIANKYEEVCEWYDGYLFGETEIFNPWSLINYISDKCEAKAFWQSTGSNEIIGEILTYTTGEIEEKLQKLLIGQKVTTYIDTNVIYPELQNNPSSIYSFLLIAGYLKIVNSYHQIDGSIIYDIAIPNKEITFVYEKEILNKINQNGIAISIQQAIFNKDTTQLQKLLEDFMLNSISSFDVANESFYHGMMLGLCAILNSRYYINSNRESGFGRFDVQLMPRTNSLPGFIFEFKCAKDSFVNLEKLANEALNQIKNKKYDSEMKEKNISEIIKIGIAFFGKKVVVKRA